MYDFLVNNSIFVVLIISLMIWFGISIFLFTVDNKLSKLEKMVNNFEDNSHNS
ncbi:MAG: CcmD family protein [Candidatus Kapaibacteriota bacterium]|jgi:hypothetical protein